MGGGERGRREATQRILVTGHRRWEVRESALFLFSKELGREFQQNKNLTPVGCRLCCSPKQPPHTKHTPTPRPAATTLLPDSYCVYLIVTDST